MTKGQRTPATTRPEAAKPTPGRTSGLSERMESSNRPGQLFSMAAQSEMSFLEDGWNFRLIV